jgi:hypothetical protein
VGAMGRSGTRIDWQWSSKNKARRCASTCDAFSTSVLW